MSQGKHQPSSAMDRMLRRAQWVLAWLIVAMLGYFESKTAVHSDSIPGAMMLIFGGLIALGSIIIWTEDWLKARKVRRQRRNQQRAFKREAAGEIYYPCYPIS